MSRESFEKLAKDYADLELAMEGRMRFRSLAANHLAGLVAALEEITHLMGNDASNIARATLAKIYAEVEGGL